MWYEYFIYYGIFFLLGLWIRFEKFKYFVIYMCFITVFVFGSAAYNEARHKIWEQNITQYKGIVVTGYCTDGTVKNTNKFPVTIKCVYIFKGEETVYIKEFQPKEIHKQYISHQLGYYIIQDGKETGYFKVYENNNN